MTADDELVDKGCSYYAHILPATGGCYCLLGEDNDIALFSDFSYEDEIFHYLHLRKASDGVKHTAIDKQSLVAIGEVEEAGAQIGQIGDGDKTFGGTVDCKRKGTRGDSWQAEGIKNKSREIIW